MPLTQEQRNMVVDELKRFATDLSLSEDQKQKLQGFLSEASEKLHEYKEQNPNASREDLIRKVGRQPVDDSSAPGQFSDARATY